MLGKRSAHRPNSVRPVLTIEMVACQTDSTLVHKAFHGMENEDDLSLQGFAKKAREDGEAGGHFRVDA